MDGGCCCSRRFPSLITMEILYKVDGDGAKGTYINIVIAQRTVEVCYHLLVPLTTQTLRSVCLDYFIVSHQRYSKYAGVRKVLALTPRQINRINAADSRTAPFNRSIVQLKLSRLKRQ